MAFLKAQTPFSSVEKIPEQGWSVEQCEVWKKNVNQQSEAPSKAAQKYCVKSEQLGALSFTHCICFLSCFISIFLPPWSSFSTLFFIHPLSLLLRDLHLTLSTLEIVNQASRNGSMFIKTIIHKYINISNIPAFTAHSSTILGLLHMALQ